MKDEEVYDYIINCKKPMSLVRLGDGEVNVLRYPDEMQTRPYLHQITKKLIYEHPLYRGAKKSLVKHLGYMPEHEDVINIKENLKEALRECDILGQCIDPLVAKRSKLWGEGLDIAERMVGGMKEKIPCDMSIHINWMFNGQLYELFSHFKKIAYVSGRDLKDRFVERYGLEVDAYHVDPQYYYQEEPLKSKHYPTQYKEIEKEISKKDYTGVLCVVGAGMVGKNYCTMFKRQGGIAVDLGSVFDFMYGKVTRGGGSVDHGTPPKGSHSYCDKYKL